MWYKFAFVVINAVFNLSINRLDFRFSLGSAPGEYCGARFDTIVLIITEYSLCNENLELFLTFVHFWKLTEGYNKSTFKKNLRISLSEVQTLGHPIYIYQPRKNCCTLS